LYQQLKWSVSQLSVGYYVWRAGFLTTITLEDNTQVHIAPNLNAGTAALQILFSKLTKNKETWEAALNGENSITATYEKMFGSPWLKASEPLYPQTLTQPELELPFSPGHTWSFTGGPHSAWGPEGALAALDFAPPTGETGCTPSEDWITAVAPGEIVRSADGVVVLDLDGDGHEQTGWDIMYLHVATPGRVPVGTFVKVNDYIGHASCEGGEATGSHVHIVRKFNGEWILADGAVPFVMSGWTVHKGSLAYEGTLTKDDQVVISSMVGSFQSLVTRSSTP
jgi:LasA protease